MKRWISRRGDVCGWEDMAVDGGGDQAGMCCSDCHWLIPQDELCLSSSTNNGLEYLLEEWVFEERAVAQGNFRRWRADDK